MLLASIRKDTKTGPAYTNRDMNSVGYVIRAVATFLQLEFEAINAT